MRAKELVGGAHQEITAQRLYVDQVMRGVMNGIDIHLRTDPMRGFDDGFDIDNAAGDVGGVADRHQAGVGIDALTHFRGIQCAVGAFERYLMHHGPSVGSGLLPAGDVGVVIQRGDDNLIAGLPVAADDAAEMKSQRGHVHAEDDGVGRRGI